MKIALVTNIPAPYRLPIYERVNKKYGDDFVVIYAAKSEANRSWDLDAFSFNHLFLKENVKARKDGFNYVHNNVDVWSELKRIDPDVVITTGFNPTHLYAYAYTKFFGKKHIPMTDGWIESERHLSFAHKLIRKLIFKTSNAFIGAGKNSLELYRSYGIENKKLFQSHLCIDNARFSNDKSYDDRQYDLMFSGQFIEQKLPFFFAEVIRKIAKKVPGLKVLILGDGPLKVEFLEKLDQDDIVFDYAGFVSQKELPKFYSNVKLFLFTTKMDAWGVVVNEAMASGTPVISTPFTGAVKDLIIDGKNGYILKIDSDIWSKKIISILNEKEEWAELSKHSKVSVHDFNFDNAAKGIVDACKFAYGK